MVLVSAAPMVSRNSVTGTISGRPGRLMRALSMSVLKNSREKRDCEIASSFR